MLLFCKDETNSRRMMGITGIILDTAQIIPVILLRNVIAVENTTLNCESVKLAINGGHTRARDTDRVV